MKNSFNDDASFRTSLIEAKHHLESPELDQFLSDEKIDLSLDQPLSEFELSILEMIRTDQSEPRRRGRAQIYAVLESIPICESAICVSTQLFSKGTALEKITKYISGTPFPVINRTPADSLDPLNAFRQLLRTIRDAGRSLVAEDNETNLKIQIERSKGAMVLLIQTLGGMLKFAVSLGTESYLVACNLFQSEAYKLRALQSMSFHNLKNGLSETAELCENLAQLKSWLTGEVVSDEVVAFSLPPLLKEVYISSFMEGSKCSQLANYSASRRKEFNLRKNELRRVTNQKRSSNHRTSRKGAGDATALIISSLVAHHKYENGKCDNFEPLGVQDMKRRFDIPVATASDFFKDKFGSHSKYVAACNRRDALLVASFMAWNQDFAPKNHFGRTPTNEGKDEEE